MKIVAVFSIKGGVGKSAMAVNLSYVSATMGGRRTLLWDLDPQAAASYLLQAKARGGQKGFGVIQGEGELQDLIKETTYPNLDILPADNSLRFLAGGFAGQDDQKQLKRRLKALAGRYDRVILDCAPGLSDVSDRILKAADLIVAPLVPAPLSLRTYEQLQTEILKRFGNKRTILPVWNMVDRRRKLHRETIDTQPDWPVVPYSSDIEAMSVRRAPLGASGQVGWALKPFVEIWRDIEQQLPSKASKA